SGGIHPHATPPDSDVAQPDTATASPEQPTSTAQFTRESTLPEPRAARPMKRDKDGAILPAGRRQGELTDLITSNDDFYVVTKNAGGDPFIEPADWRLRVDGEVKQPIQLDYASLRKLPQVEVVRTLECISNFAARCDLAPF